jgi:glycine hydroxymethyltransferase
MLFKKINSAVFPFYQGGPLVHIIAGKAIAFKEAMEPEFSKYAQSIIDNAKACREEMAKMNCAVDYQMFV